MHATAANDWMVGCDTAGKANAIVSGISPQTNYITWSQQQMGGGTGVWPYIGRYLVYRAGMNEGLTTESNGSFTSTGELSTIFDNRSAIVLVDNRGTNDGWGTNGVNGTVDAQKAKAAAVALGIPAGLTIFVDVETKVANIGNYLSLYRTELETKGSRQYKMGVYCSTSDFTTINNIYSLANTNTWLAKWSSSYVYPNWPTSYSSDVAGKGKVRLWQFISEQYKTKTNVGTFGVDLNVTTDSYPSYKDWMYHPLL